MKMDNKMDKMENPIFPEALDGVVVLSGGTLPVGLLFVFWPTVVEGFVELWSKGIDVVAIGLIDEDETGSGRLPDGPPNPVLGPEADLLFVACVGTPVTGFNGGACVDTPVTGFKGGACVGGRNWDFNGWGVRENWTGSFISALEVELTK